ncbi:hypothetical protein B0T21DRAFT_346767 [Apiosordaria backusii]|uniref:Uncharacterized protein n=1 Tax=Apiosordaria backusii TaxID=314023 RepID=A0AA40BSF0_9PEZI|nr:hypothetical protein B0T21DRAFT_346767 [Apiosordaria backusii]
MANRNDPLPVFSPPLDLPDEVLADFGHPLQAPPKTKEWRLTYPLQECNLRDVFSKPLYRQYLGSSEPQGQLASNLIENYRIVAHPEIDKFPDSEKNEEYNDEDEDQRETLRSLRNCHNGLYVARGGTVPMTSNGWLSSDEMHSLANRLLHWVQQDKRARLGSGPGKPTDAKKARWWICPAEAHMFAYSYRGKNHDGTETFVVEGEHKQPILDSTGDSTGDSVPVAKSLWRDTVHVKSRDRFNQATFTVHFAMGEQHWMVFILHKPNDPKKDWNAFFMDSMDQPCHDLKKYPDAQFRNRKRRQGAEKGFHEWLTKNFPNEERLQNCMGSAGVPIGSHPDKPALVFHFRKVPTQGDGFSCSLQCILNVLAFIRYESWGWDMIPYFRNLGPIHVVPVISRILHNIMGISVGDNTDSNYFHDIIRGYEGDLNAYNLTHREVFQKRAAKKAEEEAKKKKNAKQRVEKRRALHLGGERIIKLLEQAGLPVYSVEQYLPPDRAPDVAALFSRLLDLPNPELFPTEIHGKSPEGAGPSGPRMTTDTFQAFKHYEQALRDIRNGQPIQKNGIVPLALRQLAALQAYNTTRGSYSKGSWFILPTPYILTVGEPGTSHLVRLGESDDRDDGFYYSRGRHRERFDKSTDTIHFVFWEKTKHWAVILRQTKTGNTAFYDSDSTFEAQNFKGRWQEAKAALGEWLRHNDIKSTDTAKDIVVKARPSASESHWDSGLFALLNLVSRHHYDVFGWHQLPLQAFPEHTSIACRRAQVRALHNLVGLKMHEGEDKDKDYKSPTQPRFAYVSHPQFVNKRWDGRNERDNAIALLRPPVASKKRSPPQEPQANSTQQEKGEAAKKVKRVQEVGEGEGHGPRGNDPSPETARSIPQSGTSPSESQVDKEGKCQREKAQLAEENLDLLEIIQGDEQEISRLERTISAMRKEILRTRTTLHQADLNEKNVIWATEGMIENYKNQRADARKAVLPFELWRDREFGRPDDGIRRKKTNDQEEEEKKKENILLFRFGFGDVLDKLLAFDNLADLKAILRRFRDEVTKSEAEVAPLGQPITKTSSKSTTKTSSQSTAKASSKSVTKGTPKPNPESSSPPEFDSPTAGALARQAAHRQKQAQASRDEDSLPQFDGPHEGSLRGGAGRAVSETPLPGSPRFNSSKEDYELNWRARRLGEYRQHLERTAENHTKRNDPGSAATVIKESKKVAEIEYYWITWKRRCNQVLDRGIQASAGGEVPRPPTPAWYPDIHIHPLAVHGETERYLDLLARFNKRQEGLESTSVQEPRKLAPQQRAPLKAPVPQISSSTEVSEDEEGNPLPPRKSTKVVKQPGLPSQAKQAKQPALAKQPDLPIQTKQAEQPSPGKRSKSPRAKSTQQPPASPDEYERIEEEESEEEAVLGDPDDSEVPDSEEEYDDFSDSDLPEDLTTSTNIGGPKPGPGPVPAAGGKRRREDDSEGIVSELPPAKLQRTDSDEDDGSGPVPGPKPAAGGKRRREDDSEGIVSELPPAKLQRTDSDEDDGPGPGPGPKPAAGGKRRREDDSEGIVSELPPAKLQRPNSDDDDGE